MKCHSFVIQLKPLWVLLTVVFCLPAQDGNSNPNKSPYTLVVGVKHPPVLQVFACLPVFCSRDSTRLLDQILCQDRDNPQKWGEQVATCARRCPKQVGQRVKHRKINPFMARLYKFIGPRSWVSVLSTHQKTCSLESFPDLLKALKLRKCPLN